GPVESVRVHGAWTRDRAYYQRSPWAGRRRLEGRRVADGVATNPLAHGVHAGLVIAGIDRIEDIAAITTELRRAHDIEADDTTLPARRPGRPRPGGAVRAAHPRTRAAPTLGGALRTGRHLETVLHRGPVLAHRPGRRAHRAPPLPHRPGGEPADPCARPADGPA